MCLEANTGFTVSLLNNSILCGNDNVHAGGDYFATAPYTYPFACGSGEAADLNIFFGEKDQLAAAMGSAWPSSDAYAGISMTPSDETNSAQARASNCGAIIIPRRPFYGADGFNAERDATIVKYRALFLEEIGHNMGLKTDRVEIPMSETMFHDFGFGDLGNHADYTPLDKKAFEILYLKYKDGTNVFNTEMTLKLAHDAFNKWVAEYNGDDSSGGGDGLPKEFPSKHVELSGVDYVLRDGPSSVYNEGDQDRNPAEMIWGNLNGVYTLRTNDISKRQIWEKKEPMPPKEIIVSGACGLYGGHDKRWDGTGGSSVVGHDRYDFKWFPNVNGKYVQYWPLDVDRVQQKRMPESMSSGMWAERNEPSREPVEAKPSIPDYLGFVTKYYWTPNTYFSGSRRPQAGDDNYMEVFDGDNICWQYPIYVKYPARAKIYESADGINNPEGNTYRAGTGTGVLPQGNFALGHVGYSPIMKDEAEWPGQLEDYSSEDMDSRMGLNGKSLFALEYLKIFVSYYKPGPYGGIAPTLGPRYVTEDGVAATSLGPTWMIVLSNAVSPGDSGSLKNHRISTYQTIYNSYAYGDARKDVSGSLSDDQIIWLFNPKEHWSDEGQFHLEGLNHKLPPDGPEWKYLGRYSTPEPPCNNKITLKTSGNGWYTHQIELQDLSPKRPDSSCGE